MSRRLLIAVLIGIIVLAATGAYDRLGAGSAVDNGVFGASPSQLNGDPPTATNTPVPTLTLTPENTPTEVNTPVPKATSTPEHTPTETSTPIPTETFTPEHTPTETNTPVPTETNTPENTPTADSTVPSTTAATDTPIPVNTSAPSETPTNTPLPPTPVPTYTPPPPTRIISPNIQIMKGPDFQTIANGGTARFRIEVKNTGNVKLKDISLNDPLSPGCNRQLTPLNVGEAHIVWCSKPGVNVEFTNAAKVEANDYYRHSVSDEDTARVEIENPNINIVKSPGSQTVRKGERAMFEIFVVNTSKNINLEGVEVIDPLTPACNKTIGDLPKQAVESYKCETGAVVAPFINEITVTGRNEFNDDAITDSHIANVEVLDMQVALVAEPVLVDLPGGSVEFSVSIMNEGSVPIKLLSLQSPQLGNFSDASGSNFWNNNCPDALMTKLDPGNSFSCAFTTGIEAESGTYEYGLTVEAEDDDRNKISSSSTTNVIIADSTKMEVSLKGNPASLPAPGGTIEELVLIRNLSADIPFRLDTLLHSELGDLDGVGNCSLPQIVAAQESYDCNVNITVSGKIGEFIIHTLTAAGISEGGLTVGNRDQESIYQFDPARRQHWLPIMARTERHPEEENDDPCTAFRLISENVYRFAIDDLYDWYYFDAPRGGLVTIQIDHLTEDAQVAVFANDGCDLVSEDNLVAYNGDDNSSKTMLFSSREGRHYVFVADLTPRSIEMPYTISVRTP